MCSFEYLVVLKIMLGYYILAMIYDPCQSQWCIKKYDSLYYTMDCYYQLPDALLLSSLVAFILEFVIKLPNDSNLRKKEYKKLKN